jgi:cell division transport system ATP-binding protein
MPICSQLNSTKKFRLYNALLTGNHPLVSNKHIGLTKKGASTQISRRIRIKMIQLTNVSKIYPNGARALVDISLKIDKGEFVFLVGPSGAGKSTLIRLLYREELPNRGQVIMNGKNLIRMRERDVPQLRRSIGVIFQDFRLLPNKTVFENVAFALEVIGVGRSEVKNRTKAALELVGLGKKEKAFPNELSGGEQQRVSVARAIVNNPALLVADEPTGNLDPETAWDIMELLYNINRRGTTIVMATHAREIVDQMQKRVIAIEDGKVARDVQRGMYGYDS